MLKPYRSQRTRHYVAATCHSDKSLHVFRSGDKLLQQVAWQSQWQILLCVQWRIFVKIFVSATEFCHRNKSNKFSLIWFCETSCRDKILLWRQRFSQKFSSTNKAICPCNVLLQLVTHRVPTLWHVLQKYQVIYNIFINMHNIFINTCICFNIKSTHLRFWQIQSHRAL